MKKVTAKIIEKMIDYFDGDVKRINHALKVFSFVNTIGRLEGITRNELFLVEVAALLHDIGIKESERKYNSAIGKYQEIEGPPVARELLKDFNIDLEVLERILFIIGNHHSYGKIDQRDFQILVEADFLVNIYEDGNDADVARKIRNKHFKTKSGTALLNSMYKPKN